MANSFKSKLDNLVKSMSSFIMREDAESKDEFTLQCEECDSEIERLKDREKELYTDIGIVALERYGAEAFDELGQSMAQLQAQIKETEDKKAELIRVHEEELRAAEEARKAEEERKAAEEAARLAEEAARAANEAKAAAPARAAQPAAGAAICPVCGHANASGMKFCGECGARLTAPSKTVCPVCGYENAQGVKFCGECGTRLEAPAKFVASEPVVEVPATPEDIAPVETPVEAPVESPVEEPVEAPVEAPVETETASQPEEQE